MINLIRITDLAQAKRLQEISEDDNLTSLLPDICILRLLQEEAFNAGNHHAVLEITKVIGSLSHNTEIIKIRQGELLSKPIVLALAAKFAQLLTDKVAGRFDGWEEVLKEVREESTALIVDARNSSE